MQNNTNIIDDDSDDDDDGEEQALGSLQFLLAEVLKYTCLSTASFLLITFLFANKESSFFLRLRIKQKKLMILPYLSASKIYIPSSFPTFPFLNT